MKKLDVSFVSNSVGLPLKSGSLIHMQNSYKETVGATIIGLIGPSYDANQVYILHGLVNTATPPDFIITEGAVFYNGEVYLCYGNYITGLTPPNVMTFAAANSFVTGVNADPVFCTDGLIRNCHRDERMIVIPGLSGANFGNYEDARFVAPKLPGLLNPEMYLGNFSEFDGTGIGITQNTRGYQLCNGQNGSPDMRGMFIVGAKSGDANFSAAGATGGSKTVNASHTHSVSRDGWGTAVSRGVSGGLLAGPNDGGASWAGQDNTTGAGGNAALPILPPYYSVLYVVRLY